MPWDRVRCTSNFAGRVRNVLASVAHARSSGGGGGGGSQRVNSVFVLGVPHIGTTSLTVLDCALGGSAAEADIALPFGVAVVGQLISVQAASDFAKLAQTGELGDGVVVALLPTAGADDSNAEAGSLLLAQAGEVGAIEAIPLTSREFLDRHCYLLCCRTDLPVARRMDGSWAALGALAASASTGSDHGGGRGLLFRLPDGRFVMPNAEGGAGDGGDDAYVIVYTGNVGSRCCLFRFAARVLPSCAGD
jgi:hypothetical protein